MFILASPLHTDTFRILLLIRRYILLKASLNNFVGLIKAPEDTAIDIVIVAFQIN